MKTQRAADIAVGCFVGLFGIFVLFAATMVSVRGAHRLSPRTFPYVVGSVLLCCGAALAFKSWSLRGEDPAIHWPDRVGVRAIIVTLGLLACYLALLNPLGLPLSTFLYITFAIWYLKRSRWLTAIMAGLISGALSYFVFIRLLRLSFPEGFLFGG